MKLTLERDEYGVNLSDRDVQVARSLKDIVRDGRDLLDGVRKDELGVCEMCEERAFVRGFALIQDGQFFIADLCAECQSEKIRAKREQYQAEQQNEASSPAESNGNSGGVDLSEVFSEVNGDDVERYQEHYDLPSAEDVIRHRFERGDPDGVLTDD